MIETKQFIPAKKVIIFLNSLNQNRCINDITYKTTHKLTILGRETIYYDITLSQK